MTTLLGGVIGWPVSHSLSPHMHSYWLHENGIAGTYVALAVRQHELSRTLDTLRRDGFQGVNLTLPHKEAAYAVAYSADSAAHASKAANLVLFRSKGFEAHNTDTEGLARSLRDGLGDRATRINLAVVLGSGGAARAAVLACDCLGAKRICVVNRTRARADALVRGLSGTVATTLFTADWRTWETHAPQTNLLINATSAGLAETPSPAVSLALFPPDAAVCDLVYNPLETALLAKARAQGLTPVDGLGMLMHQGALAFELLFGVRPSVSAALRAHLEKALRDGA
jgi:shikimate dehydrogenase